MNEQLRILLLGSFRAVHANEPVLGFKTNKGRALLAYLAIEQEPVYDEFLASLLWPETTDQKARRSLNQEILTIRKLLGDAFILRRERTIQLNGQSNVWLDLTEFTHLLQQCNHHPHHRPELCSQCAKWRTMAVALWRGEFLQGLSIKEGEEFDRWLAGRRQQLHLQRMTALAALTQFHEWRGEWEPARLYAQQQLDLEPWHEEAHQQLMRIWACSGQRGAAVAHYHRCCALLKQELGVTPLPETVALYERLRTTNERHYTNLPEQPPQLIGRQRELADLSAMLAHPDCRLVTIAGLGGVGKTRLAFAVAQQRCMIDWDGVVFVALRAVTTPSGLVITIAEALQLTLTDRDPTQQLLTYLCAKKMLLVLDNFEHLVVTVKQNDPNHTCLQLLVRILHGAPQVKLLVTSRVILNLVPYEWVYDLGGLAVPAVGQPDTSAQFGAIQLFVQRAQQVRHEFTLNPDNHTAIVHLCRLLEGVPLAIELAAAWVRQLSCAAMIDAVLQNLDLLATTSPALPERQRSMRATFDYSWRLLQNPERSGLRNLAIFHGGFTAAAAQQVADVSPQMLDELVRKYLVQQIADDRYDLHELVHQFAAEQLALRPELQRQVQDRHGTYYLTFLAQQEESLEGPQQQVAMAVIRRELANIAAAWEWMVAQARFRLVKAALYSYGTFYHRQGWYREGKTIFSRVVHALEQLFASRTDETDYQWILGCALIRQGSFCEGLAEFAEATAHIAQGRALLAPFGPSRELALALRRLGWLAFRRDAYAEAIALTEQSVALDQSLNDQQGVAGDYNNLGVINLRQHHLAQARHYFLMSAELIQTQSTKATNLLNLGKTAQFAETYAEAEAYRRQALTIFEQLENQHGMGVCLANLGQDLLLQGKLAEAQHSFEKSLRLRRDAGDRFGEAESLSLVGLVAFHQGRYNVAETFFLQSLALSREVKAKWFVAEAQTHLGTLGLACATYAQARQQLEEGLALFQELGLERFSVAPLAQLADVAHQLDQSAEADQLVQKALQVSQRLNFQEGMAISLCRLGCIAQARGELHQAQQHFDAGYAHAQAIGNGLQLAWTGYYRARLALSCRTWQQATHGFAESMTMAVQMGALPIALHCLAGFAELRLSMAEGRPERALELLMVVTHHSACSQRLRDAIQPLQSRIKHTLQLFPTPDQEQNKPHFDFVDIVRTEIAFGKTIL